MRSGKYERVETHTIFDRETGLPVTVVTCKPSALQRRVNDKQIAIPGRHRGAVRLNKAGEVETDTDRAEALISERRRDSILQRIDELERKQLRPQRELQMNPSDAEAMRRLDEINAQISALRQSLKSETIDG